VRRDRRLTPCMLCEYVTPFAPFFGDPDTAGFQPLDELLPFHASHYRTKMS
jgi:hypothetical protein